MMSTEKRIERLERRRHTDAPLDASRAVTMGPDGRVAHCVVSPEGPPASGLAEFYASLEHRTRDTCPESYTCDLANCCRASVKQTALNN